MAAFDSVDRCALGKALRSKYILDILVDIMAALHEHTVENSSWPEVVCSVLHYVWCPTKCTRHSTILCGSRLDYELRGLPNLE